VPARLPDGPTNICSMVGVRVISVRAQLNNGLQDECGVELPHDGDGPRPLYRTFANAIPEMQGDESFGRRLDENCRRKPPIIGLARSARTGACRLMAPVTSAITPLRLGPVVPDVYSWIAVSSSLTQIFRTLIRINLRRADSTGESASNQSALGEESSRPACLLPQCHHVSFDEYQRGRAILDLPP